MADSGADCTLPAHLPDRRRATFYRFRPLAGAVRHDSPDCPGDAPTANSVLGLVTGGLADDPDPSRPQPPSVRDGHRLCARRLSGSPRRLPMLWVPVLR